MRARSTPGISIAFGSSRRLPGDAEPPDARPVIGPERPSSRGRFPIIGSLRRPASPAPASTSPRPSGSFATGIDGRADGAWWRWPSAWASPSDRPAGASTRPRRRACSPSPASRDAGSSPRSWNRADRRMTPTGSPSMGRSRGIGGTWPSASPAHRFKPPRPVGSRPGGGARPSSPSPWAIGPTSASLARPSGGGLDVLDLAGLIAMPGRSGRTPRVNLLHPTQPPNSEG